jgi:hypothetical protein
LKEIILFHGGEFGEKKEAGIGDACRQRASLAVATDLFILISPVLVGHYS